MWNFWFNRNQVWWGSLDVYSHLINFPITVQSCNIVERFQKMKELLKILGWSLLVFIGVIFLSVVVVALLRLIEIKFGLVTTIVVSFILAFAGIFTMVYLDKK